ncbi:DUF3168 domain-containing protein [Bacteroides intestinalis]|uniref:DUF3168 domain-containing protein n=1 Tax=Bacteroides intestinalis TaxID=329854 RepID=A0A412XV62_9BACE|nr:DUF3168 domain-containing protein [Bacteroides intestinalis]RGV49007.1 DUF3168 domain-containing protein [Bacteroides intestinalis]
MDMFKITTEVRTILLDNPNIVSLVEDKIFPVIAPDGTEGDFITYQRDGYKQTCTKYGVAEQIPYVNVAAVSDDYNCGQELASLIYDTLSGDFRNPDIHIQLEDSTEDFIDNKFIQVLQFSIQQK